MELYQIRQFVAVAETGSFTKRRFARWGFSTRDLRCGGQTEEDNGQKLLDRRRAPSFLRAAEAACSTLQKTSCSPATPENLTLRAASRTAELRVGVCGTLPTVHVVGILPGIWPGPSGYPDRAVEGPREELEQRIVQKKPMSALTSPRRCRRQQTSVALFTEPYVLAVNQNHHRFAKLRSLTLDDLRTSHSS